MSAPITIQDLDEATAAWISEEAVRRGMSVEAFTRQLLQKGVHLEREQAQLPTYHDLDPLAGTWSEEQANEFLSAVNDFEQVDEKLWQ